MDTQFITTNESPTILVEKVEGNLRLKGQDEYQVTAKSDHPDDLSLETRGAEVMVRSMGDLSLRVPRQATVKVQAAHGEVVAKALDGLLEIGAAHGNVTLRGVAETHLDVVHGELAAKNIAGTLTINKVDGNTAVRDVQGDFIVSDAIEGNLQLNEVNGDASATVRGNLTIRLDPSPSHNYAFTAGGNLFCQLAEDASVEISIPSANKVSVNMPEMRASAPVMTPYALTLGDGDAHMTLSAGGNIVLDSHAPDWSMDDLDIGIGEEINGMASAIGEQIEQQIEAQMRMVDEQLNAQIGMLSTRLGAARLSEEQARHIEERVRQAGERATARAQERMRHAQERLEKKLASAQRRIEHKAHTAERAAGRHGRHWSFVNLATTPPTPPGDPVSEEERLMILRMLEQKKISMEEAEELLSALEGKE